MTSSSHHGKSARVAVVGGGVIGLATGWRLAREGFRVEVFERDRAGRAASWVAGGMLAPVSEYGFDDDAFYAFGSRSLERYPSFLDELAQDSGMRVPLDTRGSLMVALDRDDAEAIRRLHRFRESRGLEVSWLAGTDARAIEPLLSPRVGAAMWIPDDHQVDNRALVDALVLALRARGGALHEHAGVEAVRHAGGRVTGVRARGEEVAADVVVLAAGCWTPALPGLPEDVVPPVRPIKGQIVSLRAEAGSTIGHVVRTPDVYLVPKADGRLIVGATQEEMGFDTTATAGPVMRLLERAWEAVPSIYDLAIDSIDVGLRPGTRDHLPVIGETGIAGLILATGHYRHGILLAPATADAVCAGVAGGFGEELSAFAPDRFAPAGRKDGTEG
ncbi:MAG: glycine oxidase ThiO [Candidatus Krumholzibacteria bacterium]|nr:glycine oxidase ThiO [Candidatus Krumholzibacteria bacterium]